MPVNGHSIYVHRLFVGWVGVDKHCMLLICITGFNSELNPLLNMWHYSFYVGKDSSLEKPPKWYSQWYSVSLVYCQRCIDVWGGNIMLGRHGLETYVTPSESWDCSQRKKGEIIEARKRCNEIEDSREAELSLTEQSVVPISYSLT